MARRVPRRLLCALGVVAAVLCLVVLRWSTMRPDRTATLAGHVVAPPRGAVAVGDLPASEQLHLVVGLRVPDSAGLASFVRKTHDPADPSFRHFLKPSEFVDHFSPSGDQYGAVLRYLAGLGCAITDTTTNRLTVSAACPAGAVETAMGIKIRRYRAADGRSFIMNSGDPRIPADLASIVQSIGGLQTVSVLRSHVAKPATSTTPPGYSPQQIATAYDSAPLTSAGYDGAGQTIGVITAFGYDASDLTAFDSEFGLPDPSIGNVDVDGASDQTTDETALDVEWSHALAPGASIRVYEAADASLSTFTDAYNRFVSDGVATVGTTSWGICEDEMDSASMQQDATIFAAAAAQGITIFAASGDAGAFDCQDASNNPALGVDYPAADANVIGAGGTTLHLNPDSSIASEVAWSSASQGIGSGGGPSDLIARPTWQAGAGVPSGTFRAVPDVALNADPNTGYTVISGGVSYQIGGTSAAAPAWAGIVALIQEYRGNLIGFGNPLFYGAGRAAFHDVTSGDNLQYSAGPGWDYATGLGSPDVNALARTLVSTPASTPTTTSTPTVTGTPTATPTPWPIGSSVVNGGFETGDLTGWQTCGSTPPPAVSSARPHAGSDAALLGWTGTTGEPSGDSAICQDVLVPSGGATLSVAYWGFSTDTVAYDWQEAQIRDTQGNVLATIFHLIDNGQTWRVARADLSPYAGQTVQIYLNVHEDGYGDQTYMYVDDVALAPVGTATPTPSPSATLTATATSTATWTTTPTPSPTSSATATPSSTATAPDGGIQLSLSPSGAQTTRVGSVIPVSIVVAAGPRPVDSAQAYLDLDPNVFAVTDQDGNPVATVSPGVALPVVLQNTVSASAGQIDFAAGAPTGSAPSGSFVLASFYLKALEPTTATGSPITFNLSTPRQSAVASSGTSMLDGQVDARYTVLAAPPAKSLRPYVYIPSIASGSAGW